MMLKLYQFTPCWNIPNPSPLCMKLETYLRLTGREFENYANTRYLQQAPKGKLPYIEDQGRVLGDSSLIIDYLKTTYQDDLDQHLSPAEKTSALAMQRLFEDHLYWVMFCIRWLGFWPQVRSAFFGDLPLGLRSLLPPLAKRRALRDMKAQGMARHSLEEIYEFGRQDLEALALFLGDKPYFMGDRPTSLDATAYGFLVNLLEVPIESDLKRYGQGLKNLQGYCDRIKTQFYGEA